MNLPKNENTMRIIIRWSMIKSLRVVAAQWRAGPSWYCNTIWEALCLQINGIVSPSIWQVPALSVTWHNLQPPQCQDPSLLEVSRVQYHIFYFLWSSTISRSYLSWLGLVLTHIVSSVAQHNVVLVTVVRFREHAAPVSSHELFRVFTLFMCPV